MAHAAYAPSPCTSHLKADAAAHLTCLAVIVTIALGSMPTYRLGPSLRLPHLSVYPRDSTNIPLSSRYPAALGSQENVKAFVFLDHGTSTHFRP